jgi:ribosomal protein S18 acetylase RimI-like enzyme
MEITFFQEDHIPQLAELTEKKEALSSRKSCWWLFAQFFKDTSFSLFVDGKFAGVLMGFVSQNNPKEAYAHKIEIAPWARRKGYGRELFKRFEEAVSEKGVSTICLTTMPQNEKAQAFYEACGFELTPLVRYGTDERIFCKKFLG